MSYKVVILYVAPKKEIIPKSAGDTNWLRAQFALNMWRKYVQQRVAARVQTWAIYQTLPMGSFFEEKFLLI